MKISLGYQVLIAIALGILIGLSFGKYCSVLYPIGQIFFMLLQMAVLPYLLFLLIHGLGSLSPTIAKKLFKRGWIFFVLLWAVSFGVVYCLMTLIPTPQLIFVEPIASGSKSVAMNLITLLVPQNIFYDLSNNMVPAITVCGMIGGLAVMNIEKKDYVLNLLSQMNAGIEKIFDWLAKASPLAIFSHVAVAIGTTRFDNLEKVEVCIAIYVVGTVFLTFWFLPALITSLTDFSYKEVMREFKNVCLIPFATAMPSLAFPFIYKAIKRLSQRHEMDSKHFDNTAQTVLPLSFSFGQMGNFFMLFFIIFLSFYTHHPLTSIQEYLVMALTLPMSFGTILSSFSAVTFLIEKFHFPVEAYQVFLTTSAITMNFQVLLSIASVLTLIILILSAYYGLLKVKWGQLIRRTSVCFVFFGGMIVLVKPLLKFDDNFTYLYRNLRVSEVMSDLPLTTIYNAGEPIPPSAFPALAPMERVLKSGVLRVGYFIMDTPFCYLNRFGEMAGYDVSFAYQLARDLDVNLEFIPIDVSRIGEQLKNGEYDIAMSALVMTEQRLTQMDFVKPIFEQNNVLIVPIKNTNSFVNLDDVVQTQGLKIGGIGAYYDTLSRHFPLSEPVSVSNFKPLIDGEVDAVLWSYLSAFVWCLAHPEFTIIDYQGRIGKHFFSYAVQEGTVDWMHFLQNWMFLKDERGFSAEMYSYWIEGQQPVDAHPRWSLIQSFIQWLGTP
ncbi:MAG: cation:dicarboxylase symporter family transporter [Verrucomicrobia bacterium]|nr:cation:dicarboxylase symporter family transporter [Verrucomicrobiota bacterium]